MPELPEVETVVRQLRPALRGRRIVGGAVRWPRTVGGRSRAFLEGLTGAEVDRVERRAKYLLFHLRREGGAALLLGHLRMTGRLHVEAGTTPPGPYERVRLELDDGRALLFDDVRKFGRLRLTTEADAALAALGPEPLGPSFGPAWLARALGARRRRLKPLLLDQRFLAGLGNIYVDEALHAAGLHPLTPSQRVGPEAAARLARAIRRLLARAVKREGSSFDAFYRTPEGRPGGFQDELRVYGREGRPCRACGTPIERFEVGQRGTHVCPGCQPGPR